MVSGHGILSIRGQTLLNVFRFEHKSIIFRIHIINYKSLSK